MGKKIFVSIYISIGIIVFAFALKSDWVNYPLFLHIPIHNQELYQFINVEWNTYTDERYGYQVEFPSRADVHSIVRGRTQKSEHANTSETINGGVGFSQKDGFGIMAIHIFENTPFATIEEWFMSEEKSVPGQRRVLEQKIMIAGYPALVTYIESDYELKGAYQYEKTTAFIKDRTLYKIQTRLGRENKDHEHVWNSFKFFEDGTQ